MKRCPKCGNVMQDVYNFCEKCGVPLVAVTPPDPANGKDQETANEYSGKIAELHSRNQQLTDQNQELERRVDEYENLLAKREAELTSLRFRQSTEAPASEKKGGKWKTALVCVAFVGIIGVLSFLCLYYKSSKEFFQSEYHSALEDYRKASDQASKYKEASEWLNRYIAIIDADADDQLYHTYDCDYWDWSAGWTIIAYNNGMAEAEDYEPCPDCH